MKTGLGISIAEDTKIAAERAVKRALSQNSSPHVALLFSSGKFAQNVLVETVCETLPQVKVIGTSTGGGIFNIGCFEHAVAVLLLSSDAIDFLPFFSSLGEKPEEAGLDIGRQILNHFPGLASETRPFSGVLMASESRFRGVDYLKGLMKSLNCPLPISGGGSLNTDCPKGSLEFFNGFQYLNKMAVQEGMNFLLLKAKDQGSIRFGYSFESSWSPVASPVACTKADGSRVFEVNNQNISEYFKSIFGDDIHQNPEALSKYSFITKKETSLGEKSVSSQKVGGNVEGAKRPTPILGASQNWRAAGDEACEFTSHAQGGRVPPFIEKIQKSLIRSFGFFDQNDGSCMFFPQVDMKNETIQLVQLSREELIEGAGVAARQAYEGLKGYNPVLVMVFSCHLRNRFLKSINKLEIEEVRKVFGDLTPIIGYYAGGEYSPLFNTFEDVRNNQVEFGSACQLSTSISILAIGEKDRPDDKTPNEALNYFEILLRQIDEDKKDGLICDFENKRVAKLEEDLREAENNIVITESTLKRLNTRHFRLARELEEKNQLLNELVLSNQKLQKIIKQYTPKKVWEKANKSVELGLYRIPDEEGYSSILFMDVKGFTSFAENHSPTEVIRELNRIFESAVQIIYGNNGDIDKFIGDCIFALFDTSAQAFRSARAIQEEMKALQAEGFPFSIRIGINQGRVIRGNVGGFLRRENTLIGDAVNMAQRLESHCTPGKILLSQEAFKEIESELLPTDKIETKSIMVKGKKSEIQVTEITL